MYILNLTFTHIQYAVDFVHSETRTQTAKQWRIHLTLNVIFIHIVMHVYANSNNFCAVIWKMRSITVYLPMYLPLLCATRGSDTVKYIKKQTAYLILLSPPERKWMSYHWDCLFFIASNISDVYMLFGAASASPHFELHWPLITLKSLYAKMHLIF